MLVCEGTVDEVEEMELTLMLELLSCSVLEIDMVLELWVELVLELDTELEL